MKTLLRLSLVIFLFASCNESPKSSSSAESKNMDGLLREVTGKNTNKDVEYARLMDELIAKTPLTNAQFLEAFPKKLGSLNLDATPSKGSDFIDSDIQILVGNYGNGTIKMEITDAVRNLAGLAVAHLKNYDLMNYESDDNTKYIKMERNGFLTSGVYVTSENDSELKFLYDNRFYISLEGKGMDVDKLWDELGVENLHRFKDLNK